MTTGTWKRGEVKTKIKDLVLFNPSLTDTEIAKALNVSRQLVGWHFKNGLKVDRLPRKRPDAWCIGCGAKINKNKKSGMCRECKKLSYAYEFTCKQCGTFHTVTGTKAKNRRNSRKQFKKYTFDFCNQSCSMKFFMNWDNAGIG
jgi:hypothetical protein